MGDDPHSCKKIFNTQYVEKNPQFIKGKISGSSNKILMKHSGNNENVSKECT